MSVDFIKRQLEIIKGLMGYRYGDDVVDKMVTDYIANMLTRWGLTDIRDLSVKSVSEFLDCPPELAPDPRTGYQFVRAKSNTPLTTVFWNNEWSSFDCGVGKPCTSFCGVVNRAVPIESSGAYRLINSGVGADEDPVALNELAAGMVGDNIIFVWVKFTDTGIPYFFAQPFGTRGMTFGQAFQQLAMIALAATTFVVPGVNAAIASTIFGPLATAYPALTAAASNVMLNTALNGGDVEAAVKNVAASYVGQSSGQLISGLSDSQALGRLAASAVSAAARGGDVQNAVVNTALQLAPAAITNTLTPSAPASSASIPYHDPVYDAPSFTPAVEPPMSTFDIPSEAPVLDDVDYTDLDFSVGGDFSGFDSSVLPLDMSGDPMFDSTALSTGFSTSVPLSPGVLGPLEEEPASTFSGSLSDVTNTFVPTSVPTFQNLSADESFSGPTEGASATGDTGSGGSSFFGDVTFTDVVKGISDTAIALLRVNQAYQAAGRPSIQPATRTTVSGANQTVRADGTIATTDPVTGAVTVNRAPVGVPYALSNGSVVTNNGDGTYTTITSSGARTSQYAPITSSAGSVASVLTGSTIVSGVPNWALIGGGAVALALLLKR